MVPSTVCSGIVHDDQLLPNTSKYRPIANTDYHLNPTADATSIDVSGSQGRDVFNLSTEQQLCIKKHEIQSIHTHLQQFQRKVFLQT